MGKGVEPSFTHYWKWAFRKNISPVSFTPFRHPRFFAPVMYVNLLPRSCPFCPRVHGEILGVKLQSRETEKKEKWIWIDSPYRFSNLFLSLAPEANSSRFRELRRDYDRNKQQIKRVTIRGFVSIRFRRRWNCTTIVRRVFIDDTPADSWVILYDLSNFYWITENSEDWTS